MRRRGHCPPSFPPLILLSMVVLVSLGGCRKAPPAAEIPVDLEGSSIGRRDTVYATFHAHEELLEPNLRALLDSIDAYVAAEDTECFRMPDLTRCDVGELCGLDADPAGIASVAHAEVLPGPVSSYLPAFFHEDWSEVFPGTFLDFELVEETDREAFLAGERALYTFSCGAAIDAVLDQASYYAIYHMRRIDDWDGTGEPLVLVRSYIPEPATTNTDNATMDQLYSMQLLVPTHGGADTLRLLSSWSGLVIGDLTVGDAFNLACPSIRENFTDLQAWTEAQR